MVVLSLTALLVVLWGTRNHPCPDEGTGAHIFQLSIAAPLPLTIVYFTTADWSQPWRSARPVGISAALEQYCRDVSECRLNKESCANRGVDAETAGSDW